MYLNSFYGIASAMIKTGVAGSLICAAIYAVFAILTRKKLAAPMKTHILRYVFLTYCICVLLITLREQDTAYSRYASANFFPLYSVISALMSGFKTAKYLIILNIIMFMPLGILLPCVFKRVNSLHIAALISLLATLTIECIQIFLPGRAFDIDDIILNTLGGAIGYSVYAMCIWVGGRKQRAVTRVFCIAVLLIIPLFLLGYNIVAGNSEFEYALNYQLDVPRDIEINVETASAEADIYEKAEFQPRSQLEKYMGILGLSADVSEDEDEFYAQAGEMKIMQDKSEDFCQVQFRQPVEQETNIDNITAEKRARDFFDKCDLWDGDAQVSGIDDDYAEGQSSSNSCIRMGKVVEFTSKDGRDEHVYTASVDKDGVWSISIKNECYEVYERVKLMTPEQAMRRLGLTGRCEISYKSDQILDKRFTADGVELTYVDSSDGRYKLPAWKLSGEFFAHEDEYDEPDSARGWMVIETVK